MKKTKKTARKHIKQRLNIFWVLLPILFISTVLLGATLPGYFLKLSQPTGKRTVEEDTKRINALCSDSKDTEECFSESMYTLTQKTNYDYAVKTLLSLQQINPDARGCHSPAHRISNAENEKNPQKWEELIKKVSTTMCTGGFMHGVIESHLATDPEFTINDKSIEYVCGNLLKGTEIGVGLYPVQSCSHNMGHLMLTQEEGKIQNAVNNCVKVKNDLYSYECLSGAFMENLTRQNMLEHSVVRDSIPWNEETARKMEKLCNEYSGVTNQACWQELSFVFFTMHDYDAKGLYTECQRAPTQEARDACFIYGAGNLVHFVKFNPQELLYVCDQTQPNSSLYKNCMNQIMGALLSGNTDNLSSLKQMCTLVGNDYRKDCMGLIINNLKLVKSPTRLIKETCSTVSEEIRTEFCSG